MFKVYQVQVPREQFDAVNELGWAEAMEKFPAVEAHMACHRGSEGFVPEAHSQFYQHVCNIDATDLEDVFRIGNMGPEESIERLAPMHSVSVGDIVVSPDGVAHMVDNFGFSVVGYKVAA